MSRIGGAFRPSALLRDIRINIPTIVWPEGDALQNRSTSRGTEASILDPSRDHPLAESSRFYGQLYERELNFANYREEMMKRKVYDKPWDLRRQRNKLRKYNIRMSAMSAQLDLVQEELIRERALRLYTKDVIKARKESTIAARDEAKRSAYATRLTRALEKRLDAWDESGVPFSVREPSIAKAPSPTAAAAATSTRVEQTAFFSSPAAKSVEREVREARMRAQAAATHASA